MHRVTTLFLVLFIGAEMGFSAATGAAEKDVTVPTTPSDRIGAVKAMKTPLSPTPEGIAVGKALF